MKKILASFLLAALLGMPTVGAPALAQNADGTLGGANSPPSQQIAPNPGQDAPSPVTGELVPPPGPPPEGAAAEIKLPDCTPGKCGVPQIMSQ
jgi:hypothetical protein